jgi:trimeric autotransporter adhesin
MMSVFRSGIIATAVALAAYSSAGAQQLAIRTAPAEVVGGGVSSAVINLSGPAPAGGLPVSLQLSRPELARFAGSNSGVITVTIPGGDGTITVPIRTRGVRVTTAVTVTAKSPAGGGQIELRLAPARVKAIVLKSSGLAGGQPVTAEVVLDGAAPDNTPLTVSLAVVETLSSLQTLSPVLTVPATVTIPGGATSSAPFAMSTRPVASPVTRAVSARLSDDPSVSVNVPIRPPKVLAVRFAVASMVGGSPVNGTVELDGEAPPGGMTLTYGVVTGQGMRRPPNGTITVGARSAPFTASTAVVSSIVADGIQVLASTTGNGSSTSEGRLKILPPATGK